MNYIHFILTKFNLKLNNTKDMSKDTFIKRLNLFKSHCYKSIEKQTNQNFKWLVFFDEELTDKKDISDIGSLIAPIFLSEYRNNREIIKQIKNHIIDMSSGYDYLITTRLDSDDCLNEDYIKTIQSNFSKTDRTLYNSSYGYVYNIDSEELRMVYRD